ncbi:MAG: tetratricopeptide repeat protein [Kofleriaceae bacterium]|nr:tetratricopeptide repeat protein [Kofleriaceae bacterium]
MSQDTFHDDDVATLDLFATQLEAFRKAPDAAAFIDLRDQMRAAGAGKELAELCARWAPLETDASKAAEAWSESGEALLLLGVADEGLRQLRKAIDLDPTSARAIDRFVEHALHLGDAASAAEVVENELTELGKRTDSETARGRKPTAASIARRAEQHRIAAQLWNARLGRIDRALWHWQQAWRLEPARVDALEAARTLYASLGDTAMVAKLYQAELDVMPKDAPGPVKAAIRLELAKLSWTDRDAAATLRHLEEAARLDTSSIAVRELLADVYTSPEAKLTDGFQRAALLLTDIGKTYRQRGDTALAMRALRRALAMNAGLQAAAEQLEPMLAEAEQWTALDALLSERAQHAPDAATHTAVLQRRADLLRGPLHANDAKHDNEALIALLREIAATEAPYGGAATELRALLRANQQWSELSAFIEQQLATGGTEVPAVIAVAELLELATIAREHQSDRDRAAQLLHHALSIAPEHEEALARYVDHFRERRDWRGLCDLYEFALDNARAAGAPIEELERRLEEIGQLAELRMGDIARATDAWQRIAEISPHNPKVSEALRRLRSRAKMWEELVAGLESDVAAAPDVGVRTSALRRMAQTYRERQIEPRRAIDAFEQLLSEQPGDDATLKSLAELYEREGDDAGLALTMRRQLDADLAAMQVTGLPTTPREWPVAKRTERLNMLRRLANIYDTRLAEIEGVVFTCTAILDLIPGDRDALERMERVLDKANDPRLEQTLEYHAAATQNPSERCKLYKRLATMAATRHDESTALDRWEKALASSPSDTDALTALGDLYERNGRWIELADVLERIEGSRPLPEPGSPQAAHRTAQLERYADIAERRLADPARATKLYARILEISPKHRAALSALTTLHRNGARWRELAEVLGRQVEIFAEYDPTVATSLALEQASVFESRLGSPNEAIRVLEALLSTVSQHDLEAHTALRALYESRGNFDAAVRVAEREMYLTNEPNRKIARGLEIGATCRDRLTDNTRALQAFERVLAIDPTQQEALAATAELLGRLGRHKEQIRALEKYLETLSDTQERCQLMSGIAGLCANKLGDHRMAFRWYKKSHDELPDQETIMELRQCAEAYELWREFADFLSEERKRLIALGHDGVPADPAIYVQHSRELARIAEQKTHDRTRAIAAIGEALAVQRRDATLLAELERLAQQADARPIYKQLLDGFDVALGAASPSEKVDLHLRRARIFDEKLGEPRTAMAELLAAFSWAPHRSESREALYALAPKARAWAEVVALESALVERATSTTLRLMALRRKASVLEEQLKDAPRAFRTHLIAFLIDPNDAETIAALWRLARVIGRYRDTDKVPKSDTALATVQNDSAFVQAQNAAQAAQRGTALSTPKRPATEELLELDISADDTSLVGDSTQPLDLEELEMSPARRQRGPNVPVPVPVPAAAPRGRSRPHPTAPPPIPGGSPRSTTSITTAPPVPAMLKKGQASIRRTPVPSLPNRAFDTPWDEFAYTFENLPAADGKQKLRWLFAAAEVWETGAKDVGRAFDTLANAFAQSRKLPNDDGEARARLHRVTSDHKAWDRLGDLYQSLAETANTPVAAADLLMEVASIRLQQRRPREAEAQLRRILGIRPDDVAARARLEGLYRQESRWVELAAALEERTDPRLGSAAPPAERPALLAELASIYTQRLNRPHDAIEAYERLRALTPADVAVYQQLAEQYAVIARWSKAIESLGKISEVAEGSPDARAAQAKIASIYERELELPDRAIEAYTEMVTTWPDDTDAWEALDRLYTQHARWHELTDVLRRRAAQARTPKERAMTLARRAQILLDWLEAPEEAAAALRHAKSVAEDEATQDTLSDQLIVALSRAGRDREAASILENRIGAPSSKALPAGELAALHLRLAELRAHRLRDPLGARAAVDAAIALVPEHPTALALVAKLAATSEDPALLAQAKLRQAETAVDDDARVAALMEAGAALRDRNHDPAGAKTCFEQVLQLRPYHADATWALAGLVEQSGEPEAAATLLATRLEDQALVSGEKARIHTQLAALSRAAGVEPAAERHLREALASEPGHVPAVVALADFYTERERYADLEAFLRVTLGEHSHDAVQNYNAPLSLAPAALVAELHRRLAFAFERLGRDEDAYQTLMTADRLARGHLLIKLALGENRYKARRWREAALHLAPLANHEEAGKYALEVAQGLYHGALAEIRSLRPDRAAALYARALELRPNFAPALQALAEIAMEQGDAKRASELLSRQAEATEDPSERLRLFEAIGDMALMMLSDEERARQCYAAAVAAAKPLESKHVPLLEKLLERQDLAGDFSGSARTAELMSAFGVNQTARAARLLRAARDYASANDMPRARAAAERAIQADPTNLETADFASELALANGETEQAAATLGRCLSSKDDREPVLRALLWHRLGVARALRGDGKQAKLAFERAVAVAPQSLGAMNARRDLVGLGGPEGTGPMAREHLRTVAAFSGELRDVIAYADTLQPAQPGQHSDARLLVELVAAAGHTLSEAQNAVLALPAPTMSADAAYRGILDTTGRAMLSDPELGALAPIIATIAEAATLLWPDLDDALARRNVRGAVRVAASNNSPALAMFPKIAAALGTGAAMIYQHDNPLADATVICTSTPVIVLSTRVMQGELPHATLRAIVGHAVELTRLEHVAIAGLSEEDARRTVAAVVRMFGPPSLREAADQLVTDQDVQRAFDETVKGALSVKLRTRLEQFLKNLEPAALDLQRYRRAVLRTADRAALLLGGAPATVVELATARGQALGPLLATVAHPHWAATRAALLPG